MLKIFFFCSSFNPYNITNFIYQISLVCLLSLTIQYSNISGLIQRRSFLLSLTLEKVLFWGQLFKILTLMDFYILRSPESENHIFSKWSVCMSVFLCVCYQHNSKTNYSRNIKFGILHLHHTQMLIETFHKYQTKNMSTAAHK